MVPAPHGPVPAVLTGLLLVLVFGALGAAIGFLGYAAANELVSLTQNWRGLLDSLQGALDQTEELFARLWTLCRPS